MIYSHVILPYTWSKEVTEKGEGTLIIYVSHAFQFGCYKIRRRGGEILIEEEEVHLRNCIPKTPYEETKALGERLILSIETKGCKIVILRPGLLVGRYSYHPEWKILYKLAKKGILIGKGIRVPVTPAVDIPRIGKFLLDKDMDKDWFHVVPYTLDIGELHRLMIKLVGAGEKIRIPVGELLKKINKIRYMNVMLPISMRLHEKMVYSLKKLGDVGYVGWTSLTRVIRESVKWMESTRI